MKKTIGFIGVIMLLASCAKMGAPDGGWYDEDPPKVLGAFPANGATNVNSKKITIYFDEYVKLDNPSEKVVVSPPQLEQPEIKEQGRSIVVKLQDDLKPNTTYTIDFSDAISDNSEGNPLGNFTYTFSTGNAIDTLEIAGHVLNAENLEPIKGIHVGLYDIGSVSDTDSETFKATDTLLLKVPMLRVSSTDEKGHFVIKGVSESRYRVFALQDMDGDYRFTQKAEKLAFNREIVVPTCKPDIRQDTLWRDSLHILNINRVGYTHFLPDDITLTAFQEKQTDRALLKATRQQADNFMVFFSYGNAELPKIKGLNFDETNAFVVEPSVNQDTITYWLRDTALVNQDTLQLEMQYLATDTLGVLHQNTDTLELISRQPYAKRMKQMKEAEEKWSKQQERRKKRGESFETVMPVVALEPDYYVPSSLDPDQNLLIKMKSPIQTADTAAIHLYTKVDTLWQPARYLLSEQTGHPRVWQLIGEWQPGAEYSLEIDSAAFVDIYGKASKAYKQGFKVKTPDEFSTVIFTLTGMEDKHVVVQLLNNNDAVVKEVETQNGVATLYYVKPGTYFARLFVDENDNGIWDTGNYAEQKQAEAVYYYPESFECKAKWDVQQTWNPTAKPLAQQKPAALRKQKQQKKQTTKGRNIERARSLGIEYAPR